MGRGRTRKFREREEDAERATVHLAQKARGRLIRLGRYSVSGGHGNEGEGSGGTAADSLGQHCKELDPCSEGGEEQGKALSRAVAGPEGSVHEKGQLGNEWCLKRGMGSKNINEH